MKKKITILGGGAWGTAIGQLLADNGHQVLLWCHEEQVAASINNEQVNRRYMPDIELHKALRATTDLASALIGQKLIFQANPVAFLRNVVQAARQFVAPDAVWVSLSKGIEAGTLKLPTQIIDDVLGYSPKKAALSGPNFAVELAQREFTATTLACNDDFISNEIALLLTNRYFRIERTSDLIGSQLGGALKNILALAVGIAHGLGHKVNTAAYLITKGLQEMALLSAHWGGLPETMYGLSGLGDVMLTCTGDLSKNLRAGYRLAHDRSLQGLQEAFATLPEGINTVQAIHNLIIEKNIDLPVCQATYAYIFENGSFEQFLR